MRNFLFAAAMAKRDGKKFFGVLAICPEPSSGALVSQVEEFRQEILLPKFRSRVKFLTYENLIDHLQNFANAEANALAAFLKERIDRICQRHNT